MLSGGVHFTPPPPPRPHLQQQAHQHAGSGSRTPPLGQTQQQNQPFPSSRCHLPSAHKDGKGLRHVDDICLLCSTNSLDGERLERHEGSRMTSHCCSILTVKSSHLGLKQRETGGGGLWRTLVVLKSSLSVKLISCGKQAAVISPNRCLFFVNVTRTPEMQLSDPDFSLAV